MKIVRIGNKWKVAIDGRFVATYDSAEEAENHSMERIIPVPVEVPDDVNFGPQPYEKIDGLAKSSGSN